MSSTASNYDTAVSLPQQVGSVVSHFWFCCYPSFSTRMLFSAANPEALAELSTLEVFDCDGQLINTAQISFHSGSLGMLELEPLVAGCKLESGLKHGHVVVRSAAGVNHQCRIESRKSGTFFSVQREILKRRDQFVPLCFTPDRTNYIALVNHSGEDSRVRARVFCSSRTPKIDLLVPALGSRIFQLESLFPEYGYLEEKQLKAYVRLTLLAGGATGCTIFDRQLVQADQDLFRAVS